MHPSAAILVTGGAGFVGSHFTHAAHAAGARVIVLDDLSGGSPPRIPKDVIFVRGDVADFDLVSGLLAQYSIMAVVHFAGRIRVEESVRDPALYFDVNLRKTLTLLEAIRRGGPDIFLFSSTAAVYGTPEQQPITESAPTRPTNPYGMSKLAVEFALASYANAYGLRWAALRYFNAAGAHPSGTLRESHEPETHLIPLAIDAALGRRGPLTVYGSNYPTPDGTCIRDYVHVCDLADAHLAALEVLSAGGAIGATNLGSGVGFSVKQVLESCERVLGLPVPHHMGPRRAGDPPVLVASAERAKSLIGWAPKRGRLDAIIEDAARSRRYG